MVMTDSHQWRSSSSTLLANPAIDCLLPGPDIPIADATVLPKWALGSHGQHSHASLVCFKQQRITGPNPDRTPDRKRYSNLAFRRNLCLLLQHHPRFLFLTTSFSSPYKS